MGEDIIFTINKMDLTKEIIQTMKTLINHAYQEITLEDCCSKWEEVVNGFYNCIALDFDGTLRDTCVREGPIDLRLASEIARIGSNKGAEIFIATGRKSGGLILGRELIHRGVPNVKMILRNGTEIISFPSEEVIYSIAPFTPSEKSEIYNCLANMRGIDKKKIFSSDNMFRIFMDCEGDASGLVKELTETINRLTPEVKVTYSGFNIEIVPRRATKEKAIYQLLGNRKRTEVLAIGDSCSKYGNDFGMLSNFPSFCVGFHSEKCITWTLPVIDYNGKILRSTTATQHLLSRLIVIS